MNEVLSCSSTRSKRDAINQDIRLVNKFNCRAPVFEIVVPLCSATASLYLNRIHESEVNLNLFYLTISHFHLIVPLDVQTHERDHTSSTPLLSSLLSASPLFFSPPTTHHPSHPSHPAHPSCTAPWYISYHHSSLYRALVSLLLPLLLVRAEKSRYIIVLF